MDWILSQGSLQEQGRKVKDRGGDVLKTGEKRDGESDREMGLKGTCFFEDGEKDISKKYSLLPEAGKGKKMSSPWRPPGATSPENVSSITWNLDF